MSGIPYNELQDVDCTVNDTNGKPHVVATLHYAFVIPCRDCKHSDTLATAPNIVIRCCYKNKIGMPRTVGDDGFCAWGERREQ